uniref:SET domain containing 5 n=1 Tax=Salarias fasciatus TaxID=181472 RepID=A0A672INP2_SALFA
MGQETPEEAPPCPSPPEWGSVRGGPPTSRKPRPVRRSPQSPASPPPPPPPKPARPTKPRPKSRMSRYRSSSSQRARRQRQALAQQAAAAAAAAAAALAAAPTLGDQGVAQEEEGSQGPYGAEHGHGESGLGGHLLDGDGQGLNCISKGGLRYPKTKKYLVTEWLNDKIPGGDKVYQEAPVERTLRITTDPTVLATTLNMLPGLSHSSLICTAPRHYVRFGSPFNPERRRPRPLQMDGTYGCYKKRWIKQVEDESCSASVEDSTESTSSQQSTSSRSTPSLLPSELAAPYKKRRSKYQAETTPASSDHLLRPLSPITPPLPEDSLHPLLHTACGSLLPNGLTYSPMPSLPASRCNTPLQFENISSPEASPVHRAESISPEPCAQSDVDCSRPQFPDLSLPSSLESPLAVASDDFSFPGAASGQDSQGPSSIGTNPVNPCSDLNPPSREQAFRTEFNLIYTCSPLNANLGNAVAADRRASQSEGGYSPAESFHSSVSGQGLLGDAGPGSMSPYGEPHYGGGYPDSGTPPHTSNPPQKKKVSLLEYRKRKQSSSRDPEPAGGGASTQSGCGYSKDSPHPHPHPHPHMQPPASPHGSFSSSTPHSASAPQMEEVSPPEQAAPPPQSRHQDSNNQWMVPTTVERLREGQGVLERVLRSIKMERMYQRGDGSTDKDPDADRLDMASPMKSPHSYSPSLYPHQSSEGPRQTDSPSFLQQASTSPFRGSYSPSSGHAYYPRLSSHPGLAQDHPHSAYPSPTPSASSDSRPAGGASHQQSGGGAVDGGPAHCGSHLKAGLLNSVPAGAPPPAPRAPGQTKTEPGLQGPRAGRGGSPGQAVLQAGPRLAASHYPQRGAGLGQFQHPPLQGPGVRTQSGSF